MGTYRILVYLVLLVLWILYYIYGGHTNPFKRCCFKTISSIGFVLLGSFSFFYVESEWSLWMLLGLVLGMLGDISLDLAFCYPEKKDCFFLSGLGCFLLGHLAYAYVFMNHLNIWIEVPCCIVLAILFVFILLKFGCVFEDKLIPIGIYGFVILSMLLQAIKYYIYTPNKYGIIIMIAAIFFTISDVILAFILFQKRNHSKHLTQANLTSYYLAQLMLACSMFLL